MKSINWKYAFGEILIVIIGISIAFSINKCAENSEEKNQKTQYITNLANDVLEDKAQMKNNLIEIERKIDTATEILPILGSDSINRMQYITKIFSISTLTNFEPNDITYRTLINSGDLKLIDDFDLKTAIEKHYSSYKTMAKDYARQENIHKEYLGAYFINNVDYDASNKGEFGFSDEKLLKNIIQSMRGSFGIKLEATKRGVASCDTLLMVLEKAK